MRHAGLLGCHAVAAPAPAAAAMAGPAPAPAEYRALPLAGTLFLCCSNTEVHGENCLQAVTLQNLRYVCTPCGHEGGELRRDFQPRTIGELEAAMKTDSRLEMTCNVEGCRSTRGRAFFKCGAQATPDGPRCGEKTIEGGCVWLPQAVPGGTCDIYSDDQAVLFQFHPCGHRIGLQALSGSVRLVVEGGQGATTLRVSPVTGQCSFTCPVRGDACRCDGSFLHEIHHFRVCGDRAWYSHMKDWAAQSHAEPAAPWAAPRRGAEAPPDATLTAIQIALTAAVSSDCPSPTCRTSGQKDGACTHITCRREGCRVKFCYICRTELRGGTCQRNCHRYLTDLPGFPRDAHEALQEFHLAKAKALLQEVHRANPAEFSRVVEANPSLLRNLCEYDGRGVDGQPDGRPLPGRDLTLQDVVSFQRPAWMVP